MRRLDGITDTMDMGLGGLWEVVFTIDSTKESVTTFKGLKNSVGQG